MSDTEWYLGPLGDMRPLIVPEPGIEINETRYGGIHQGLSGARTMDITGYRTDYSFQFKHLDRDEFLWAEALHLRLVPGPFYLINPLKRNRLTSQASRLLPAFSRNAGVTFTSPYTMVTDWPTDVSVPGRSLRLAGWVGTSQVVEFDTEKPVPLLPGETLTASVFLKADATYAGVKIRVAWYDKAKAFIQNDEITVAIGTDWAPYWFTYHEAPTNAAAAKFSIVLGSATTPVYIAAPMLEAGAMFPNAWELGGAAPLVHIDQLPTVSNRFPLRDVSMTLLEA